MIRPVDAEISQRYGDNPTRDMPWDSWLIQTFGNYQPDGHSGEDYSCPVGTPVRAVAAGTVLHVGWMGGTYADNPWWIAPNFAGYCAVIDHGAFIGIYGHCKDGSAKVTKGQRVSEGQVFILSGNTGGSTGPHLHFEILPDGYTLGSRMYGRIDPEPLFNNLSFAGTITPIQEDEMSAAEVELIRGDLNTVHEAVKASEGRVRADVGTVHNTIIRDVGGQLAGLRELVKQLASGQGVDIDYAKVEAAAKSGAASALAGGVDVTVTVAGGK